MSRRLAFGMLADEARRPGIVKPACVRLCTQAEMGMAFTLRPQRCWALLPSRAEQNVAAMCAANLSVVVGDGATVLLWTDNWTPIGVLSKFTSLLYVATSRAGRKRVLRDALADNQWAHDVNGALTVQVVRDYLKVWELLRSVQLQPLQSDRFV
jgi:hypothetical protein